MSAAVTIRFPENWVETEQMNTWLTSEDGTNHTAWIRLPGGRILELEINQDCYPALMLNILSPADAEPAVLIARIERGFGGWLVKRRNLDFAVVEESKDVFIVAFRDEAEDGP